MKILRCLNIYCKNKNLSLECETFWTFGGHFAFKIVNMKSYNPPIAKPCLKYFSKIVAKKTIFHFFILFLRDENLHVSYVEHLNPIIFFDELPQGGTELAQKSKIYIDITINAAFCSFLFFCISKLLMDKF